MSPAPQRAVRPSPAQLAAMGAAVDPGAVKARSDAAARAAAAPPRPSGASAAAGLSGAGTAPEDDGAGADGETAPGAVADEPSDPRFVVAEAALDDGDFAAAAAAYEAILAAEPANNDAALALRQVRLLE